MIYCAFYPAYSQDCFDKLAKQAVVIDSLQKVVKTEKGNKEHYINDYQKNSEVLRDSIKTLNSDLSKLEKFKTDKKIIDVQLKQKNDSITSLKNQISEKNQQSSIEKQKVEKRLHEEKEKGRNEALDDIINSYKNKKLDDLIKYSSKLSVQRDLQLVGNNAEIKPILFDLEKFFLAIELLAQKFDAAQIKNAQILLNQIKQQSALLEKIKENLEYYKDFNGELKKTIEKLIDLDKRKVASNDAVIQKLKFNDIVSELTNYMYNYFEYGNYPYLSDIVLEIIKRKKLNPDADISDLLKKLQ